MFPAGGRPATSWLHYTTSCNTQSSAPEDGQNNCPKHVELSGIINKPLLLRLFDCLYLNENTIIYYLYQCCTVKQISDSEIYLLIKYKKRSLEITGTPVLYRGRMVPKGLNRLVYNGRSLFRESDTRFYVDYITSHATIPTELALHLLQIKRAIFHTHIVKKLTTIKITMYS